MTSHFREIETSSPLLGCLRGRSQTFSMIEQQIISIFFRNSCLTVQPQESRSDLCQVRVCYPVFSNQVLKRTYQIISALCVRPSFQSKYQEPVYQQPAESFNQTVGKLLHIYLSSPSYLCYCHTSTCAPQCQQSRKTLSQKDVGESQAPVDLR